MGFSFLTLPALWDSSASEESPVSPQAVELGLGDAKFYDPGGGLRHG